MSNQASGSCGGGYCTVCHALGHYFSECPDVTCTTCGENGHISWNCFCNECHKKGHISRYCPDVECWSCGMKGHVSRDCYCPYCGLQGHNKHQCSIDGCSLCSQAHKAIDCKWLECMNCKKKGHHARNCVGCWHCGADDHFASACQHANKLPTSYPSKVFGRQTSKNPDVTCFGCREKGHKKPDCPYKKEDHNKNMFRKLGNMDINKTVPNRYAIC
ncbi:zinc finger protein GIS2-like protein [Tanacetum coccineum]